MTSNHTLQKFRQLFTSMARVFCCAVFLLMFAGAARAETGEQASQTAGARLPLAVMLVSYHAGLSWSDDQVEGVKQALANEAIDLRIEYMDTRHVAPTAAYYAQLEQLLLDKYAGTPPAVLLASDDNALDLALQLRQAHFPGIPILFSGIGSNRGDSLKQSARVAGVFDNVDVNKNIGLLTRLRPQTTRLLFIHDDSRTSRIQLEEVQKIAPNWPQFRFEYLGGMTVKALQQKLSSLGDSDMVFMLSFARDADDRVFSPSEATDMWAAAANAPLVAQRDIEMRPGVLGGFLVTGRHQGKILGDLAVKWLHGTPVEQLPLLESATAPTFDYAMLQRWKIDAASLPADSIILNKPAPFFDTSSPFFSLTLSMLISLMVIIALLLFLLQTKKRSQLALRESEKNYRELFNSSNEAIFIHDMHNGAIIDVNARFTALYGYPRSAVPSLQIEDLSSNVAPYTRADAWAWLLKARDEGPQLFEWNAKHQDGTLFWAEVSLHLEDINGSRRIVASARDVTERKRAVARANALEYHMQQVFQNLPVALFAVDESHRVTQWNTLMENITGVPCAEMLGRSEAWRGFYPTARATLADMVLDGANLDDLKKLYSGDITNSKVLQGAVEAENMFYRTDGPAIWVHITSVALRDESGTLVGALETMVDINERKVAELALRESEFRLRAFIDNTPSIVYMKDLQGKYVMVNDKFRHVFDVTDDDLLDKTDHGILPQETADVIRQTDLEMLQLKAPITREEKIEQDGMVYEYLSIKFPIFGAKGEVAYIAGISTDITERKKIEAALQASEASYRTLIEHAPEAILVFDVQDNSRIIELNRHAVQLYGYGQAELLGKTPVELSRPVQADGRSAVTAAAEYINQALSGVETRFEWISRHADGHDIPCEVQLVRLPGKNNEVHVRGSVTDITERKAAQAVILRERNFLQALLEAIPIPIFYKNRAGIYVGCNEAFLTIMRLKREDIIGRELTDWLPQNLAQIYLDKDKELYVGDGRQVFEKLINQHLGDPRHIVFHRAVFKDMEGNIGGVIGVMLDVTELQNTRIALEELNHVLESRVTERTSELQQAMKHLIQSEKLAALGNLVAGIAHELNTPIGNIVTVASTLKDETSTFNRKLSDGSMRRSEALASAALMQQAGEMIETNAVRSAKLISDFKQVAVDQSSARRRTFDLKDTIEEVLTTLHPMLKRTTHQIAIHISEKIELDSYPGPIEQIITNLITNSLLHGLDDSGGLISISAHTENSIVVLEYSDNGKGMSEDTLAQIFDPFYTTKLGQGGSGLGLYIVYNLVNGVLGGKISATSSPGAGAHFHMRLPRTAAA
ncbi:PAS domain S-box protein [Undibacterium sp. TJN25]|uniref:sensor histidine kinase n=1 Tax=Undibacterium sp. TJN25 TaxID=3413056 RepID=UPI003BF27EA3